MLVIIIVHLDGPNTRGHPIVRENKLDKGQHGRAVGTVPCLVHRDSDLVSHIISQDSGLSGQDPCCTAKEENMKIRLRIQSYPNELSHVH